MIIQYAEPVAIEAVPGNASFEAYGRRFDFSLTTNDRVTAKFSQLRKAQLARYQILRGTLSGQPHSWVRLTGFSGRVEGAIWDGQDLYVVTHLERISRSLTTPVAGGPTQTVMFRLSDTLNAFPKNFCADAKPLPKAQENNGLAQYRGMVAELASRATATSTIPLEIEISLIGDATFQSNFPDDSYGVLLASHNVADGVFAEQVGLLVIPSDLRLAPKTPDPFTATNPDTLLGQLSTFRRGNSTVSALGLAHLMTGRPLDGDTVGIASIAGVCDIDRGVSLTEASGDAALDGLIMAHELGHNFGAVHDGTGVCASTPQTFLMAPEFNGSGTFSQCSLDTMRPIIQSSRCITPADYADVALPPASTPPVVEADVPLVLPFVVSSIGTRTVLNAALTVTAPQNVTITAASDPGCTVTPSKVTCALGDIPTGQQRTVNVTVTTSYIGENSVDAHVSADNDPSTHNNDQHQSFDVLINSDARVRMTASASTALVGDLVDFTIVVDSLRSHAVHGATVYFDSQLMEVTSATVAGGSCQINVRYATCTLDDVAGGTSRTILVHTIATDVGVGQASVHISVPVDANSNNDYASVDLRVNPVRDVGLEEVTQNGFSLIGQPFEFDAKVHSNGVQPIDNVRLSLLIQSPAYAVHNDAIESVTIGGTACAPTFPNGSYYECSLGTLAAGEIRALVIRGHGADLGNYAFNLSLSSTGDQDISNNSLARGITVMNAVDVAVSPPAPLTVVEGQEASSWVLATSNGTLAVNNASFDLTAPAELRFTRPYLPADKGTCSIVTEQHLHCTLGFAALGASGFSMVQFFLVGTVPGNYNVTATINTANDEVPGNDSQSFAVTVNPVVDVGVKDFTGPDYLLVGNDVTINAIVFTGSRPVPAAQALVSVYGGAEIASITSGTGNCVQSTPTNYQCDFGDLAGGATVPLAVKLHGVSASSSTGLSINAGSPNDNNSGNNIRSITLQVAAPGDLRVSAASSIAATPGKQFTLPITMNHTGPLVGGHLQVTLPAGITLVSMSGAAILCTGTSTLDCNVGDWPEAQTLEIDLNLNPTVTGSYTIDAKVSAGNDTNSSNNESSVAVTVSAAATTPPPATPPPTSSGGAASGGGGGGIDTTMLELLSMLVALQAIRARAFLRRQVSTRGKATCSAACFIAC